MREISSPQQAYDMLRYVSPEAPCPYLSGQNARSEAYRVDTLSGAAYEHLLERGFRRSGRTVYRPRCRTCDACRQLRIPVAAFAPSRSMRRVLRRNRDLRVEFGRALATPTKHGLFVRYLEAQHDGAMERSFESFVDFLYDSPTETFEISYLLNDRPIGISVVDRLPHGLSSVYMYFDPDHRKRSLGTFSALWEIEYCQRKRLDYYYMGYFISDCHTMSYKARFRPNELRVGDRRWITFQR